MYQIGGKVAIVTGGNSGIGTGISEALARKGAYVVIAARREKELKEYAGKINSLIGREFLYPFPVDITEEGGPSGLAKYTLDLFKKIDIIVNAAGAHPEDNNKPEVANAYSLNVVAKRRLNQYVIEGHMMVKGSGRIINVSSLAAAQNFPNQEHYTAQMKEIVSNTNALNSEYGRYGIWAHAIGPGLVNTPLARSKFRGLAIEKVGKGLAADSLERNLEEFWNGPAILQPLEIGEWVVDILENPVEHPVFETKVKAVL